MTRIAVVGAGAIGGLLGTRLALQGHAVSAYARGATLQALRTHGWRLQEGGALRQAPVAAASDDAAQLGPQDLVIIAVKAQSLPAVAPAVAALLGPGTVVLPAMNGVPWWFGQRPAGGTPLRLHSVDPGGAVSRAIPFECVVGCVVHLSASTLEPGRVAHRNGQGLIIGEPAGMPTPDTPRLHALQALLADAGFEASTSPAIERDVWYKLWGNMTFNPVSALTGATADRILDDELVREACSAAMREAALIGERIGCAIEQTPEQRHAITRKLGAFKTSMLQDAEAGRAIELDAITGAVREIGAQVGVPTPTIDMLFGLARLYGRVRGLYPVDRGLPAGH